MKKFLSLLLILSAARLAAQDDIDAMRYSRTSFYGDARFMSMAGSFGALGANLSCMNFNPAGIAMYRNGEFVVTPGIKFNSVTATHYDNNSSDFLTKLNISNIGFVTAWDQRNPYPPSSKQYANFNQRNAFGISWNRLADFNVNTSIEGYPNNSSIINDFVNVANGYYPSQLNPTYEGLAYQTYLINPQSSTDSSHYWGMMLPNTPLKQTKTINETGRMSELAFSFAHSFNDKFYGGLTLSIPMVRYNRTATYSEFDTKDQVWPFRSLEYDEKLATTGSGVNLKLGAIYRVNPSLRVGAYVHTPTSFNLTDTYQYDMAATYDTALTSTGTDYSATSSGYFKYKIVTPMRAGGSVSYIYQKLAALNADIEYVNYATAKMKDNDNYLSGVNAVIASKYSSTLNLRVGGELNIRPVVVRAGFASYGSPFGPTVTGKFVRNSYTAGVGFRGPSNVYLDLAAVYTRTQEDYYLFSSQFVKSSLLTTSTVYFVATLGVKFN
jgi:hypothetical protein